MGSQTLLIVDSIRLRLWSASSGYCTRSISRGVHKSSWRSESAHIVLVRVSSHFALYSPPRKYTSSDRVAAWRRASSPTNIMAIEDSASTNALQKSLKTALLCTIHEAESWQLENQYLLDHYPRASNSYKASLASLGYLNNQTGNVYTHIIGSIIFLSWAVQTYNDLLTRYPTSDFYDFLAFAVFFAGALCCFGFSILFHTFMNHSAEVNQTWLLMDLYGIFALIVATVYSGTYYAFYCERFWWQVYSIGVRISLSIKITKLTKFCRLHS